MQFRCFTDIVGNPFKSPYTISYNGTTTRAIRAMKKYNNVRLECQSRSLGMDFAIIKYCVHKILSPRNCRYKSLSV